jgi:two-component system nitrogen regulation sensor histidine kinase NtrY
MDFDRYYFSVAVKLVLCCILGSLGGYLLFTPEFWIAGVWLLVFNLLVAGSLFYTLGKHRRGVLTFLEAIKQRDFSQISIGLSNSKYDRRLKGAYQDVLQVFQNLSIEKATQHQFLQTIVANLPLGILVYDSKNDISLTNSAFTDLVNKKLIGKLQSLSSLPLDFYNAISVIENRERILVKFTRNHQKLSIAIQCTTLITPNQNFKILTFQDIKTELDEKEMEAWQKLIRVLTHEIMNSVIPITTLTSVTRQSLEEMIAAKVSEVNIEELNELIYSLQTIEKRSKGLVRFVEAYKSVTNIKVPVFEIVNLLSILSDAKALYQEQLYKLSITCHIKSNSESVLVMADQYLLSQVFINLLKNAIEALETVETPSITIILTSENNQINVKFVDNGCGMDSETLEQVFTPFYTTKLNGSGIGLSLCRQIIRLHGGSILAISSPKTGTIMEVIL